MSTRTQRNATALLTGAMWVAILGLGTPRTAEAIAPVVQYVTATSALNSASPKMATAECPPGKFVMGGAARIDGPHGQVAIQAAFPAFDAGLFKYIFVVKAVEDLTGTLDSWSVTASAYCTSTTVPQLYVEESPFDSNPIKSVKVQCPENTKAVGMGGEVSNSYHSQPAALVGSIPPASVVFQGFSANEDLTEVTARATEEAGALGGTFAPSWKVTAVVACAPPLYFDSLELRSHTERGGGLLASEIDSVLEVSCSSKDKRVIATGSTVSDYEMGQWSLHRFSRYNSFQSDRVIGEAYRDAELGIVLMKQSVFIICVNK